MEGEEVDVNAADNQTHEAACQTGSGNGSKTGKSKSLNIIYEFNEVYAKRLKDCEGSANAAELKLGVLQQWVADLTDQNVMLVEVVDNFEKESLYHLKVGYESQKLHHKELERLQQQVFFKNRIIETQKKALDDLKGSVDNSNNLPESCRNTDGERLLQETQRKLKITEMEVEHLKRKQFEDERIIEKLNLDMRHNDKTAREMRAALTAEVAEKHDQVLALRRDTQHMEERLRQADMQTHFKDDIIKELRKEIKIANNKLAGRLREKEMLVCCMEEKLRFLKSLPAALSPQLCQLKQRLAGLNQLLGTKNEEEIKSDVQMNLNLNLNSILFNLNEALVLVDGYKDVSDEPPQITAIQKNAICDNQHKFTQTVSELLRNQMSCEKLLDEFQYMKKWSEEEKTTMKTLSRELQTLMVNVVNKQQLAEEQEDMIQSLKELLSCIQSYLKKGFNHADGDLNIWLKYLLESFDRANNLMKQIQHKKEREGVLNGHLVSEKKIHTLQEQLHNFQDSKEKIFNKLCHLEQEQRENQRRMETALSMHKNTNTELANLYSVVRMRCNQANEPADKVSNIDDSPNLRKEEQHAVLNNKILQSPSPPKSCVDSKMKNSFQENNLIDNKVSTSHDETIRKLTSDLFELNCQLQAREKIISNQQETIDLLQNSLQMEQSEMESLKICKERTKKHTEELQEKILMLEAELRNTQEACGSCKSGLPEGGQQSAGRGSTATSKGWTPWSGKQTPPVRRHVHDV